MTILEIVCDLNPYRLCKELIDEDVDITISEVKRLTELLVNNDYQSVYEAYEGINYVFGRNIVDLQQISGCSEGTCSAIVLVIQTKDGFIELAE